MGIKEIGGEVTKISKQIQTLKKLKIRSRKSRNESERISVLYILKILERKSQSR